jgi:hypothetical protein
MIAGNLEAQPPLDVLAICGTGVISKITLLRLPRDPRKHVTTVISCGAATVVSEWSWEIVSVGHGCRITYRR